jgi:hypothetical protein
MIIGNGYAREGQKRAQVIIPASKLIRDNSRCRFSSYAEGDSSILNTFSRLQRLHPSISWCPAIVSHCVSCLWPVVLRVYLCNRYTERKVPDSHPPGPTKALTDNTLRHNRCRNGSSAACLYCMYFC